MKAIDIAAWAVIALAFGAFIVHLAFRMFGSSRSNLTEFVDLDETEEVYHE